MKLSQCLSQDQPYVRLLQDADFQVFGGADSEHAETLAYCDTLLYWNRALENPRVTAIIATEALAGSAASLKGLLIAPNPRVAFYRFYLSNFESLAPAKEAPRIGRDCQIDPTARISPGTTIGDGTVIEAGVTVKTGTVLGKGVRVHSGAILGADGLLYFTENGRNIFLPHSGGVQIADHAVIMANAVVARGVFKQSVTQIGLRAIIGIASTVGHEAIVEADAVVAGNCVIARGARLGVRCLVNTSSVIREYVRVGADAKVRAGSIVIQDVADKEEVSGNFALKHSVHLKNYLRASL